MTNFLPWPPKSWNYRCEPHLSQPTVDFHVGIWKCMINSSETGLWQARSLFSRKIILRKAANCLSSKTMKTLGWGVARDYPSLCFAELWIRPHAYANSMQAGPLQIAAPPVPDFRAASLKFHGEPQGPHWLQQACWRCVIITVHQNLCQPWVPKYPVP